MLLNLTQEYQNKTNNHDILVNIVIPALQSTV